MYTSSSFKNSKKFFEDNNEALKTYSDSINSRRHPISEVDSWFDWERFATDYLLPNARPPELGLYIVDNVKEIRLGGDSKETVCLDCILSDPNWDH